MTAQQSGSVPLAIATDHPAFVGHFPGAPIVPGVVLLDEALHAIGSALGADLSCCQISSVKFLSPVLPGESVSVSYAVAAHGAIKFDLLRDNDKVATGSIRMPGAA